MRLQVSTQLAIFAVLELAGREGAQLSVAEIGEKYGVSAHHLAKVMHVMGRAGLVRAVRGAGGGYQFSGNARRTTLLDVVQLFANNQAAIQAHLKDALGGLKPGGMLWLAYPKISSGVKTDITRDKGWDVIQALNLKWITLISVNETWSAFALRPYKAGEAKQSFR